MRSRTQKRRDIVADSVGIIHEQKQAEIAAMKPQPRILTINDVPARIWKPNPGAWPRLLKRLVEKHHLDPQSLQKLNSQDLIWATSETTLAVQRTDLNGKKSPGRPVTLLDIATPGLSPRILLPGQGDVFWVGNDLSKADSIVAVANPLEALSYREICVLDAKQRDQTAAPVPVPLIISLDAEVPSPGLLGQIKTTRKKFILATNTPLEGKRLAAKIPQAVGDNGEFFNWFKVEIAKFGLTADERFAAWNKLLGETTKKLRLALKVSGLGR